MNKLLQYKKIIRSIVIVTVYSLFLWNTASFAGESRKFVDLNDCLAPQAKVNTVEMQAFFAGQYSKGVLSTTEKFNSKLAMVIRQAKSGQKSQLMTAIIPSAKKLALGVCYAVFVVGGFCIVGITVSVYQLGRFLHSTANAIHIERKLEPHVFREKIAGQDGLEDNTLPLVTTDLLIEELPLPSFEKSQAADKYKGDTDDSNEDSKPQLRPDTEPETTVTLMDIERSLAEEITTAAQWANTMLPGLLSSDFMIIGGYHSIYDILDILKVSVSATKAMLTQDENMLTQEELISAAAKDINHRLKKAGYNAVAVDLLPDGIAQVMAYRSYASDPIAIAGLGQSENYDDSGTQMTSDQLDGYSSDWEAMNIELEIGYQEQLAAADLLSEALPLSSPWNSQVADQTEDNSYYDFKPQPWFEPVAKLKTTVSLIDLENALAEQAAIIQWANTILPGLLSSDFMIVGGYHSIYDILDIIKVSVSVTKAGLTQDESTLTQEELVSAAAKEINHRLKRAGYNAVAVDYFTEGISLVTAHSTDANARQNTKSNDRGTQITSDQLDRYQSDWEAMNIELEIGYQEQLAMNKELEIGYQEQLFEQAI